MTNLTSRGWANIVVRSDATAVRPPMERLLRARSIAIVGISPETGSIGFNCLRNLENFGFDGEIALVSRTRSEVNGRPCVPQVDELPFGIDAALLCLPRAGIVSALEASARRGIGAAVSFASGFAETGEAGRMEQQRITAVAREAGMAFVGPNCMGFVNYVDGLPYFMHVMPARRAVDGPAIDERAAAVKGNRAEFRARDLPAILDIRVTAQTDHIIRTRPTGNRPRIREAHPDITGHRRIVGATLHETIIIQCA